MALLVKSLVGRNPAVSSTTVEATTNFAHHHPLASVGICGYGALEELSGRQWQDMLDVNLTGVWHTVKAAVPHLRANSGGSVILTSSIAGLNGVPSIGHYAAAKHGCSGVMSHVGIHGRRVNTVDADIVIR